MYHEQTDVCTYSFILIWFTIRYFDPFTYCVTRFSHVSVLHRFGVTFSQMMRYFHIPALLDQETKKIKINMCRYSKQEILSEYWSVIDDYFRVFSTYCLKHRYFDMVDIQSKQARPSGIISEHIVIQLQGILDT
jgi:hypothetical protein